MAANEYTCLYLLSILDPFRRKFPRIEVSVQRSLARRIPEELSRRSMELGILSYRPDPARFRSQVVYVDRLVLVVNPAHPLAGQRRVSIRRLGSESFIAHKVPSPLRRQVYEAFEQHRTRLHSPVELPSLESVKRLVAMGNGVALVPGLTVERELDRGELVGVEVPELEFTRNLRLVYRRGAPLSHAAEAFLRTVRAVARERGSPFLYQGERDA
jgi:DNA-binding transcriptional LysR family regulator